MKIDEGLKFDIQCFSYFLFKGSLTPRLISSEPDYTTRILSDEQLLFECFRVFAISKQKNINANCNEIVTDYILKTRISGMIQTISTADFNPFWVDFLKLADRLCFYKLPNGMKYKMIEFNGLGVDIVPYFAIWTNIVEVDESFNVLNSEYALNRARERFLASKDGFETWEIEQEIY